MLHRKLDQIAARQPDLPALSFNGQSHSYAAFQQAVLRLRGALAARGIVRGDRVAILLPNCPHFAIAHFATLGLGAVSVPINPLHKAREIAGQLADAEASALIAWENLASEAERAASVSESLRLRVYLGDSIPAGAENLIDLIAGGEPLPSAEINGSDLAAVLYTSGVSGRMRGVELTHDNLEQHAREMAHMLRIRETDKFLGALPFAGICGLTLTVHLPLLHGSELFIQSRFHPGDALNCLADNKITVLIGNPSAHALMTRFPSAEKYDLSHLRYAISCEDKLPVQLARDIEEILKIRLFEGYGTTETCGVVALNLFPSLVPRGSVGQPLDGHEITVFDEAGPAAAGVEGEIAVRGPVVMRGYRNLTDKTAQTFRDGWFLTGDRGYLDEQCNLFVTGHGSEVIIKGGFTIYCREVEEIVEGLPHVREVAVVGIPDPVFGQDIKACVVLKEGASIGPSEIIEYVKERVAVYKCPKLVKLCRELPRAPNGKINRGELAGDRS